MVNLTKDDLIDIIPKPTDALTLGKEFSQSSEMEKAEFVMTTVGTVITIATILIAVPLLAGMAASLQAMSPKVP